jgi:hypothetical protein
VPDAPKPIRPKDVTLRTFGFIVDSAKGRGVLRRLLLPLYRFLFSISPAVPSSFVQILRYPPTYQAFIWGYGLGFFFCFVVIAVWSILNGTFHGLDPNRLYFSQDTTNLINYLFLCPAYIGLCAQLIVLTILSWSEITKTSEDIRPALPRGSLGLFFLLVMSISGASTINFILECLKPSIYPKIGWWVGSVAPGGMRVLSGLGIYYAILNFALLSVCVTALLAFLSLFFLCLQFGNQISKQPFSTEITFESIQSSLTMFTQAYIVLKLLIVTLMLNAYVWKKFAQPRGSMNLAALGLVLTIIGVFLISVPRYYIELEWFKFRVGRAMALNQPINLERDDLRPFNARLIAGLADSLIIGGFAFSFFA